MMAFLAKGKDYSKVCRKAKVARMVTNVLIRDELTGVDDDILRYPVEHCEEFESYTTVKDYITKQAEERKRKKEKREHREDDHRDEDDEKLKRFIPLAIILVILLLLVLLTLLT